MSLRPRGNIVAARSSQVIALVGRRTHVKPAIAIGGAKDLRSISALIDASLPDVQTHPVCPRQGQSDIAAAVKAVSAEFENVRMVAPAL